MFVHGIRCPLKIIPLTVPAILLLYWFVHGMRVQAQVNQTTKVRELQEQRLATLREVARLASLGAEVGHKNPEELWAAIKARGEAELDVCTSNAERIGVLEALGIGHHDDLGQHEEEKDPINPEVLEESRWGKAVGPEAFSRHEENDEKRQPNVA